MGTKSRETLYGTTIRASAERAKVARRHADVLACEAWNYRMLGYKGPAQPSPTIVDALNASYGYLEVSCYGCDTHQTVALDIIRRPKQTSVHDLERHTRCKDRSHVQRGAREAFQADWDERVARLDPAHVARALAVDKGIRARISR